MKNELRAKVVGAANPKGALVRTITIMSLFCQMKKLMDILLAKRDYSWAPKFVAVLESVDHLKWLAQKIIEKRDQKSSANDTDEAKKYGTHEIFLLFKFNYRQIVIFYRETH